jgi:hypothetical protein
VKEFYREIQALLGAVGIEVRIRPTPVELPDRLSFTEDTQHANYDASAAARWWTVVRRMDTVFKTFRARFDGKCSPVHFFWGSFDLAVTRFSGRSAPPRPGGDVIERLAYNEEVSSLGFWPGAEGVSDAVVYSYASPQPPGFSQAIVRASGASYNRQLNEFVLPYETIRRADNPEKLILEFAQSTYEAAANLGQWDRKALELAPQGTQNSR